MILNVLEKQYSSLNQESSRAKYLHLSVQNSKLTHRIHQLQGQIISLKKVNELLQNCHKYPLDPVVSELKRQIQSLEKSVARLMKSNDQLQCDLLMKTQLICQNQGQFKQILTNYEEKILELRIKCQSSELRLSQLQQRPPVEGEEQYGTSTQLNLMCFNEINDLRMMLNRFSLENAELKCVISKKEQENNKIKEKLQQCEKTIRTADSHNSHKQSLFNSGKLKNRGVSSDLVLNDQVTQRNNQKNKIAAAIIKSQVNPAVEINKLKALVIKYLQDNINLEEKVKKMKINLGAKNNQHEQLKEACRKLQHQLRNNKVQVQFYRHNFKELTKVTKQRKMHYYQNFYGAQVPTLKRRQLYERQLMIKYWKDWVEIHGSFAEKLVLSRKLKVNHHRHRSASCPSKTLQIQSNDQKTKVCGVFDQQSILEFIDEINEIDSDINLQLGRQAKESNQLEVGSFEDGFSMIVHPTEPDLMAQFSIRKSQFVTMEVDLYN